MNNGTYIDSSAMARLLADIQAFATSFEESGIKPIQSQVIDGMKETCGTPNLKDYMDQFAGFVTEDGKILAAKIQNVYNALLNAYNRIAIANGDEQITTSFSPVLYSIENTIGAALAGGKSGIDSSVARSAITTLARIESDINTLTADFADKLRRDGAVAIEAGLEDQLQSLVNNFKAFVEKMFTILNTGDGATTETSLGRVLEMTDEQVQEARTKASSDIETEAANGTVA